MSKQDQVNPKGIIARRDFLKKVTTAGAGVSILGVFPAASKKLLASDTSSAAQLKFGGDVQLGKLVPVIAKCEMLQVEELDFMVRKGYVRVDVGYRFIDGKREGGAAFKMQLLSADKKVLAEQVVMEKRIRDLFLEQSGGAQDLPDEPNRYGKAEFRFRNTSPIDVQMFFLEISPVNNL